MKTAGIVVDNYKIEYYKKTLQNNGLTDYEIKDFSPLEEHSIIKVKIMEADLKKLDRMCKENEVHFKTNKS